MLEITWMREALCGNGVADFCPLLNGDQTSLITSTIRIVCKLEVVIKMICKTGTVPCCCLYFHTDILFQVSPVSYAAVVHS